jgi:hypothetical protein
MSRIPSLKAASLLTPSIPTMKAINRRSSRLRDLAEQINSDQKCLGPSKGGPSDESSPKSLLLPLVQHIRHVEMMLKMWKRFLGPVLQFGVIAALGVTVEK